MDSRGVIDRIKSLHADESVGEARGLVDTAQALCGAHTLTRKHLEEPEETYGIRRLRGAQTVPDPVPGLGPLVWYDSVRPVLDQQFLVRNLILAGSLVVVFGESNSGKTFFTLDIALAIASGGSWRDLRVRYGLVVYVAGEGARSVMNRVAAYRQRQADQPTGIPFAVLGKPVDLLDLSAGVAPLLKLVHQAESECGAKCALIVIDTLARAMPGGDENSAEDMGTFIGNVDRLRVETGAAVCLVHHSGKDTARGARGHSSLRAAVDTEIEVTGQVGTRVATVTKQRDLVSGQRFAFDLETVKIGADPEDGADITSCIVIPAEASKNQRRLPSGRNQQRLLNAIREHARTHDSPIIPTEQLRDLAKALGLPRPRFAEARQGLERDGWIIQCPEGLRLKEDAE